MTELIHSLSDEIQIRRDARGDEAGLKIKPAVSFCTITMVIIRVVWETGFISITHTGLAGGDTD